MLVERAVQWMKIMTERSDVFWSLLVFITVLAFVRFVQGVRYARTLPPGPWGWPIMGYMALFNGVPHLKYGELAKKYGSIFSARLGSQLVVVLSDYRLIRDSFRREEFTGRPHGEFMNILGGYGVINSEGTLWKDERKFLHNTLRNLGMTYMSTGKKFMEMRIMREVNSFLTNVTATAGAATNVSGSMGRSIANVICSLIMSYRFRQSDRAFDKFMDLVTEGFKLFGAIQMLNYVGFTRFLPHNVITISKISRNRLRMAKFFQDSIDEHRDTFDRKNIRDLVDAYLLEIETAKEEGRESTLFQGKNHDRQMQQILGDLFSAGMETVKTTLDWCLIFMLHNPEAAKAVQDELDQVVGRSRMPTLEDAPYLPITEATILEILRRSSIVPLGTTHATTQDVTVDGYTIPAGAQVVPLLHAVHMDPELWEEPEKFMPTRFINAEGKITKPEYFMPFGVGRRMCLGDTLARMELFLFFTSTLHRFDIRLPEGKPLPSLQGNPGVTITPDPYEVCLLQRPIDLPADTFEEDNNRISDAGNPLRNVGSH